MHVHRNHIGSALDSREPVLNISPCSPAATPRAFPTVVKMSHGPEWKSLGQVPPKAKLMSRGINPAEDLIAHYAKTDVEGILLLKMFLDMCLVGLTSREARVEPAG